MSTNTTLIQAGYILTIIGQKGVSKRQLRNANENGMLPDFFEALAAGFTKPRGVFRNLLDLDPPETKIVVDYRQSLKQMVAAGHYDWKNDNIIAKQFPIIGEGELELTAELIHFHRTIESSDGIKRKLNKMGLRAGSIEELLAFGATFPDTQRQFPIIALGSVTKLDGLRFVAYLSNRDLGRKLDLQLYDNSWGDLCRFLAFPK
jgi:hypothetical protein